MNLRVLRGLSLLVHRLRDQRGSVLILLAVLGVGFAAIASFVVDYGRIANAQKELQNAADSAALSAALDLPDGTAAVSTACAYSASPTPCGTKGNTRPDLTNVNFSATALCRSDLAALGVSCLPGAGCPVEGCNAIKVTQDQDVGLLFLGGLGVTVNVHATSTAGMKGGKAYPLDVVIVLDRTGSMSGSVPGGTRIGQARAGIQAFMAAMMPSVDKIGLVLFPPSSTGSCNYTVPSSKPYETAGNLSGPAGYRVVSLRSDFRTSDSAPLNGSSALVQAVTSPCPETNGQTAYTTALQKAKDELNANGRFNAQDVIIFFTDGEANYGPCSSTSTCTSADNTSAVRSTPCGSAVSFANLLKNGAPPPGQPPPFVGGTWLYTILYTTSSTARCKGWNATSGCNTSTPGNTFSCDEQPVPTTAHDTVQNMASVGSDGVRRFYTSQDDLTVIFKRVAIDLTTTRLLAD